MFNLNIAGFARSEISLSTFHFVVVTMGFNGAVNFAAEAPIKEGSKENAS